MSKQQKIDVNCILIMKVTKTTFKYLIRQQ